MPRPKRNLHATALLTTTPPQDLEPQHTIARVVKAAGNNLYLVELPSTFARIHNIDSIERNTNSITTTNHLPLSSNTTLAELHPRFRHTIYLKHGSYVLVDTSAFSERQNKIGGEIVNVVRDERDWRRMKYWPMEFVERKSIVAVADNSDEESEEESMVGRMPPSDDEDEDEDEFDKELEHKT